MKIFFAGHRGTIASDIMPLFDAHEVIGFDKKDGLDLVDIDHIYRVFPGKVDLIFHLANIPHPDMKISQDQYRENNLEGTLRLLRVAKERKAGGIVFFSSLAALGFDAPLRGRPMDSWNDDVYPVGKPPYDEDTPTLPNDWTVDPYGVSKVYQERAIKQSGMPYLILRLGPYGTPDPGMGAYYNDAVSKPYVWGAVEHILNTEELGNKTIHACGLGMWGGKRFAEWKRS